MNERLLAFIENSFLKPLLDIETITDISYNGVSIFYMDNLLGRKKSDIKITSEEASDFVRQIANLSERQFSYTTPTLDFSISKYRINAQHSSIVRVGDDKTFSFAIRIGSKKNHIEDDKSFMDKKAKEILLNAIKHNKSIVIAGPTGSGKTELQKYLISHLPDFSRVIIIDNIQELDYVRFNENLDVTSWQISPTIPRGNAEELIKNALRNNPDWIVVAESRSKEMADALNAVMSGHPIITTLHARSVEAIPHRILRLVQMANQDEKAEDVLSDIYEHLDYYVYLERNISKNNKVQRYVSKIAFINENKEFQLIYERGIKNEKD